MFKKKVGKQIAHGVAFGIKENKKAAKDEAEKAVKGDLQCCNQMDEQL